MRNKKEQKQLHDSFNDTRLTQNVLTLLKKISTTIFNLYLNMMKEDEDEIGYEG